LLSAGDWTDTEPDGTSTGQRILPLDRVGLYVPGGKAAYPSSVLMSALPARVAGVRDLVMVVPTPNGERNPLVLAAASVGGVTRAFAIGGAQAIGALAYGTETIAAVDKIVGPGNAYVASAKRRVFGAVGIDMIAGPTEIWVIADASAEPDWVAMDLFSQAEHDELAQSILLTPDAAFADAVAASMGRLLPAQPRREIISASLARRGALITTRDLGEAAALVNRAAPEHMEIVTQNPEAILPLIRHAGAIFIGHYSSEALGDYCAGPNHILPTVRTARFASPLGVYDFVKRSNVINVSAAGARRLAPIAATLARGERLEAHARSAELRAQPTSKVKTT
jgi:histidinol dehydrogenase